MSEINQSAEMFRHQYWNDSVPVDIEKIVDVKLKLNIVPIAKLGLFCDTDALLASSFQDIFVDYDRFLDDRHQNRLRFSFAHEIGHLIMHHELYEDFCIQSVEDYCQIFKRILEKQYGYLERQANKFANYLLVPRERLQVEKFQLVAAKKIDIEKFDKKLLDAYLAVPLATIFGVSEEVVKIALEELR